MDTTRIRGYVLFTLITLVMLGYVARLFSIQVLSDEYAQQGEQRVIKTKHPVPPRGNIYDRKGRIYVSNRPMFSMMITPRELEIVDTTVLIDYLDMTTGEIDQAIAQAAAYSSYKESIFARYVEPEAYGALQEQLWDFSGISFTNSNKRYYNEPVGANLLGYISEVSPEEIESHREPEDQPDDLWYTPGDQIGKSGIERHYEDSLRGKKGTKKVLKNVHNREVGSYAHGKFDEMAVRGQDIMLGIDTRLQAFGEELMQNKKGSIVAIDPESGEILAFVSAPTYNPNDLTGREFRKNWRRLRSDTLNPLYNRPLMARYPPGSIFKIPLALTALSEGVVQPSTIYRCGGGFWRNGGKPGCHAHASPLALGNAIRYSCNAYFAATYMDFLHADKWEDFYQGYNTWYEYMQEFGFGRQLGIDIPYEVSGLIPASARYDKWYGEGRWAATTVISNAIGQGEILMTPLQMANLAAILANRGYYRVPHFAKAMRKSKNEDWVSLYYEEKRTRVASRHFDVVIDAMEKVVESGTARRAQIEGIAVCGKTGTVENPHGKDHSVFIAFAPKDNPRIAIATVVENCGYGGTWAAPICALMMEKFLKGEVDTKSWKYQRIVQANFIGE